ncbi:hypothetical protein N9A80_00875 [Rhodopirellula sp.]|nr:hypothetical protein [Rhodopirellula sp.]
MNTIPHLRNTISCCRDVNDKHLAFAVLAQNSLRLTRDHPYDFNGVLD